MPSEAPDHGRDTSGSRPSPRTSAGTLSVVIPIFNEAANIAELYRRLTDALAPLDMRYELIFVNDSSRDESPIILRSLRQRHPRVILINLSRTSVTSRRSLQASTMRSVTA